MKQVRILPIGRDTYRRTKYRDWRKDITVRQGSWGHGDCVGCWFFGDRLNKFKDEDVQLILIRVKRDMGGLNKDVKLKLKVHKELNKPEGAPKFTSKVGTLTVPQNGTRTLIITDKGIIKRILEGNGIGLAPDNFTKNNYAVCSACDMELFIEEGK